jgi:hypothetical protein
MTLPLLGCGGLGCASMFGPLTLFAHQFKHKTSFSTAAMAPRVKIARSNWVDINISCLLSMSCSFVNLAQPRARLASDLPIHGCALAP